MQGVTGPRHGLMSSLSRVPPLLRRTSHLPWRHSFRKSANDIESAIPLVQQGKIDEARVQVKIALTSLRGVIIVYEDLAQFQADLCIALQRGPRRMAEFNELGTRLVEIRQGLNPEEHKVDPFDPNKSDPVYNTQLMERVRCHLDVAIAHWNRGSWDFFKKYTAVKKTLSEIADMF